jgi:hypothetical protein
MFLDISNSHSVMALNNKCYYKCNRTVIWNHSLFYAAYLSAFYYW